MKKKLIQLQNIVKSYNDENVVDDVSFYVNEKEFITFLGPSGCGKTTTLRLIGGFEQPTSGEIILDGVSINNLEPYERPINTVFQKYALFPHLNVFDNVAFGLRNYSRIYEELKSEVRLRHEGKRKKIQVNLNRKDLSKEDKSVYKTELKNLKKLINEEILEEKEKLVKKLTTEINVKFEERINAVTKEIELEEKKDKEVVKAKNEIAKIEEIINNPNLSKNEKSKIQTEYKAKLKHLKSIANQEKLVKLEKQLKDLKKEHNARLKKAKILMMTKKQIAEAVHETLKLVKLQDLSDRKIATLSGGQQQRIAIARAIINKPKILLLDEPLAALDLKLRQEMQYELKEMQQKLGITFIFVTHDQEEALTMSDTIVVMSKGKIQQIGTPEDIYNEPKNTFVANFIGESNIVDGIYLGNDRAKFMDYEFDYKNEGFKDGEKVDVVLRPEDLDIVDVENAIFCGVVESIVFKGVHFEICVNVNNKEFVIHNYEIVKVGDTIGLSIDNYEIHLMKKS